jgi:hypothetical protein
MKHLKFYEKEPGISVCLSIKYSIRDLFRLADSAGLFYFLTTCVEEACASGVRITSLIFTCSGLVAQ